MLHHSYDSNGNELTKVDSTGTTSYTWDFENRLTNVTLPGSGGTMSFYYDPFGRRIEKSSSAGTSVYTYDGPNFIEETNSSGAAVNACDENATPACGPAVPPRSSGSTCLCWFIRPWRAFREGARYPGGYLAPGSGEPTVRRFMETHHNRVRRIFQELRRSFGKIYRTSFVGISWGRILVQFDFDEQGGMVTSRVVGVYDFIWE
jgi:YD repeat-containing protein